MHSASTGGAVGCGGWTWGIGSAGGRASQGLARTWVGGSEGLARDIWVSFSNFKVFTFHLASLFYSVCMFMRFLSTSGFYALLLSVCPYVSPSESQKYVLLSFFFE